MQDEQIVLLYWKRDESAIGQTQQKYGGYLMKIAFGILADRQDSEESVNDTYWKAWNSMPPHKPVKLSAYLGKITRQRAIDLFRGREREKRKSSVYAVSLTELEECVSGGDITQQDFQLQELAQAIQRYLSTLPPQARNTFLGRYFFMDSLKEVAGYYGMSEAKVKSLLYRTRQGLKRYLQQEGYEL